MASSHRRTRRRASRRAANGQDDALARYLRDEVYAYSEFWRRRLDAAGLGRAGVKDSGDLGRLPCITLGDVADPSSVLLRPDPATIRRRGGRRLRRRLRLARLTGRTARVGRQLVDPMFKPIHWVVAGDLPMGFSASDLSTLSELGRAWLENAGLEEGDALVGILPPGPSLAFWQLALGARQAGVPAMFLPPPPDVRQVEQLAPTALAGRPSDLLRLLQAFSEEGRALPGLRTILTAGDRLDGGMRTRLASAAAAVSARGSDASDEGPAVVAAWAPPGVRALWAECRDGDGLHTWPATEVVEVIDPITATPAPPGADGEMVWTALGWHGTVLVRLRTGAYGTLVREPCTSCGSTAPRLQLSSVLPPFATVLDAEPAVSAWQAELRTVRGNEELVVFLTPAPGADPAPVLRALDRQLSVTQFVVLDRAELDERLAAHGDNRVLDLRLGQPAGDRGPVEVAGVVPARGG